ncbi:TRAP transporter small permease [Terasakiella pusilla]|uniref:TRAP transporter small permease n=1 Tax=Terasakiella pusilla TaxID=64973 RepID=UPI003AA95EC6
MFLTRLSDQVLRVETLLLKFFMAGVLGFILLNVVTRSFSYALYWVDEAAIYSMVWMVFVGMSVAVRNRQRIAVTILLDMLAGKTRFLVNLVIDLIVFSFALFLLWVSWIWYDPITLMNTGFDLEAFSSETFNFMYEEPTNTIGIPKYWVWLIIPTFAITTTLHGLTNLVESLLSRKEQEAEE